MKNGRIKQLLITLVTMMCLLAMTGCTTFDNFKHTFIDENVKDDNKIYIGVFEPQSGKDEKNGLEEIKGIELANSIYNNVNGYDVELIKVDTQSKTKSAKTAIANLVKMEPVAIIGSCGEASSLIASQYIEEAKIPTITPSATNPLITQGNKYYFRACITDSQMGAGIAEYMYLNLKSTKIAVVDIKNDSQVAALSDGFNEQMTKIVGKSPNPIVLKTETTITNGKWGSLIKEIKTSKADTVFLPLTTEQMDSFMTQAEKKGLKNITFVGTKSWGTTEFAKMASKHPKFKVAFPYDAVINDDRSTSDTVTEETQRFMIEYANKYGDKDLPTQRAALGYDSYLLVINAINTAKSNDGAAIRQALLGLHGIKGATGVFNFDSKGNTIRTVSIATVKDGKIVSDYVTKGTSAAGSIEAVE